MVSLCPAVTTTDQCVVRNTGRRGGSIPVEVVPSGSAGEDVLTKRA
jgi:hypothetical protein